MEIQEVEEKLATLNHDTEHKEALGKQLKEEMQKFATERLQEKLEKFSLHEKDYRDGNVYKWKQNRHDGRDNRIKYKHTRARSVSFNLPSSDDDDLTSDSQSIASTSTVDFLDDRTKNYRERGRRGGVGGSGRFTRHHSGDRNPGRYPLRSNRQTR